MLFNDLQDISNNLFRFIFTRIICFDLHPTRILSSCLVIPTFCLRITVFCLLHPDCNPACQLTPSAQIVSNLNHIRNIVFLSECLVRVKWNRNFCLSVKAVSVPAVVVIFVELNLFALAPNCGL